MVFVLITSVQSFLSDDWRRPELTIFCGFFCPGRRRDIYRQEVLQESGPQSFRKNVRSVGTVERCLACEAGGEQGDVVSQCLARAVLYRAVVKTEPRLGHIVHTSLGRCLSLTSIDTV
jgi:hypothetical protein